MAKRQDVTLAWLQSWYAARCDGDWEHRSGIGLGTLDNPGWWLRVDLDGTPLWDRPFPEVRRGNPETDADWVWCSIKDGRFDGAGGAQNLVEILAIFKDWAID